MNKVHIVMADYGYDGSSVSKVFASKKDAEDFVDDCEKYKELRPKYQDDYDEEADEKTTEQIKEWEKNHPNTGDQYAEGFTVVEWIVN